MKYLKSGSIFDYGANPKGFTINPFGRISTNSTNSIKIPTGTQAQRPESGVLSNGLLRYNTSTHVVEAYIGVGTPEGARWEVVKGLAERAVSRQVISGFTTETKFGPLTTVPANINNIIVLVDNVFQRPVENFTLVVNPPGNSPSRESAPYPAGTYIQFTENDSVPTGIDITVFYGFEG